MAEALYVQIGCGSESTFWPLSDHAVYFNKAKFLQKTTFMN